MRKMKKKQKIEQNSCNIQRPSWSWSHDSFIYLCNQSLSPPKLWVRILFIVRCTRHNVMW